MLLPVSYTHLAKQAKVIHFDIDPAEVNKNVYADVAVLGDCKETLVAVTELLQPNTHTEWLESFTDYERVEEEKVIRPELHPDVYKRQDQEGYMI